MIPKYRAWLKEDKEMIEVDEIHFKNGELDFIGDAITWMCKSDDCVLMQSTGLEDKNGKEIFEGDILCDEGIEQGSEFVYVTVSYKDGMWVCDQITSDGCGYGGVLNEFSDDYSVIGNIYENPELAEVKQ